MSNHLSRDDREGMLRSHIGLVTTVLHEDADAVDEQRQAILTDQLERSRWHAVECLSRMSKTVEAGARITAGVMTHLAARAGLTPEQVNEVYALVIADELALPE